MDHVLKKYCPRIEFDSYEDFAENFTIEVPEAFNFGFDVVDEWAAVEPDKRALQYQRRRRRSALSFTDIKHLLEPGRQRLQRARHRQGRRGHVHPAPPLGSTGCAPWPLCKLGATIIPASLQLTRKDVVYRANSADVKAIVAVNDEYVCTQVEGHADCPTVREKFIVDGSREGWVPFRRAHRGLP